jgi:hypothetical protein
MEKTTKRDHVLLAIKALGRPCSVRDIKEWMADRLYYPSLEDVPNYLSTLSINDRSRHHNDKSRKDFTLASTHPLDLLVKARVRGTKNVRYWFYDHLTGDPAAHVSREDLDWSYNRHDNKQAR